ncbi:hypothetical protein [Arthrobacter methylotrophus]|uniref:hypothetical protein n=1 Tax=Arthrobacter methylotrophus TaxID=121291 RepID=UPI0031EE4887
MDIYIERNSKFVRGMSKAAGGSSSSACQYQMRVFEKRRPRYEIVMPFAAGPELEQAIEELIAEMHENADLQLLIEVTLHDPLTDTIGADRARRLCAPVGWTGSAGRLRLRCCAPLGHLKQRVLVQVNRKAQDTRKFTCAIAPVPSGVAVIVDPLPLATPGIDRDLHALRVPANHQVRQQRQRPGNRNHLVLTRHDRAASCWSRWPAGAGAPIRPG